MVYAYGFNPSSKQQAYVEYVEEATFGTFPAAGTGVPAMQWFGAITNFDDQSKIKTESKPYLAPSTVTSRTGAVKNTKIGEEVGISLDFMPQSTHVLDTMCYALGGKSSGKTTISDALTSISVGQVFTNPNWDDTKRFVKFSGLVPEEYTLSIPESGSVTAKMKLVGTGKAYGAEYIGTEAQGSHATDPCTATLNSSAITAFKIRSSSGTPTAWASVPNCRDAVGGMELKVANKLGLPKDFNTNTVTKIKSAVLLSRKITLALDMTYADLTGGDIADAITFENIRSFDPFDIQYVFDGYTYEYSRVRFPELPYKAGGEDLVADKLTSLPIGEICSGTAAMTITVV